VADPVEVAKPRGGWRKRTIQRWYDATHDQAPRTTEEGEKDYQKDFETFSRSVNRRITEAQRQAIRFKEPTDPQALADPGRVGGKRVGEDRAPDSQGSQSKKPLPDELVAVPLVAEADHLLPAPAPALPGACQEPGDESGPRPIALEAAAAQLERREAVVADARRSSAEASSVLVLA
jgi:hypothetical protein